MSQAAGFEFDGERAEWLRWFHEVRAFRAQHGHCQPHPLANPNGAPPLPLSSPLPPIVSARPAVGEEDLPDEPLRPSCAAAAAAADFLLINWCSLQRIMRRSGVLLPDRDALLTGLGFDWSGADPLS